jgi:hypothetical protein
VLLFRSFLKLESRFSRRFGQGRNAAMILVIATIEHDFLNTSLDSPLGDRFANRCRRRLVAAISDAFAQRRIATAGRDERLAGGIVDDLGVNILMAAEDSQPRPDGVALDSVANADRSSLALSQYLSLVLHVFVPAVSEERETTT